MPDKEYDCQKCPYPRFKSDTLIYCDVCIQRIMDKHKPQIEQEQSHEEKQEEQP